MTKFTWHRFVDWDRAEDYLRLGWCPSGTLAGTYHEQWSVLMNWLCDCKCVEPKR